MFTYDLYVACDGYISNVHLWYATTKKVMESRSLLRTSKIVMSLFFFIFCDFHYIHHFKVTTKKGSYRLIMKPYCRRADCLLPVGGNRNMGKCCCLFLSPIIMTMLSTRSTLFTI